jgi:hypothetical protein
MYLPNYKDGSIVNLMSSILSAYGEKSQYGPLRQFDTGPLRDATNIVLFVIDGLGYEFLIKYGPGSFLHKHMHDKVTSVFPSTTATGVTTFVTGLAPQQHAITGWFMLLKEFGMVVRILPFNTRCGNFPLSEINIDPSSILDNQSLSARIKAETFYMVPANLYESDYTNATSVGAKRVYFDSLEQCLEKLTKVINSTSDQKFIYVYWAEFDGLCHEFGTESAEVRAHFKELDKSLAALCNNLKHSKAILLITSDHGLVDSSEAERIRLRDHPGLVQTMTLPLCGEPRVAYCYVHPLRKKEFEKYVTKEMSEYCTMHSARELIDSNFFGLYEPHDKLCDRIGDYALIMKNNYIIKDTVLGETEHFLKANHGGVSKQEMFVPFIVVRP